MARRRGSLIVAMDFGAYARVLRTPGAPSFVIAGTLSRFPRSTLSLGLILLVASSFGSFAAAGVVAGVLVGSMALAAPLWSSRMDRIGQRHVLLVALACLTGAVSLLATFALLDAPFWLWLVGAALMGLSTPDVAAAVRARWTALTTGPARSTAFAVESIADQTVFVTGPPIVTLLAAAINPLVGLLFSLGIGLAGSIWLLTQRATEPPIIASVRIRRAILPPPGIFPIALAGVGVGAMFGAFDVNSVAWAVTMGAPGLAGLVMALMAAGIAAGAIVVGAREWRMPANVRLLLFLATGCFASIALPLSAGGPYLLIAAPFAGLLASPVMITAITLAAARAPLDRVTESLAYPTAGTSIGVPIGATLAGIALDAHGPTVGFLVCAVALAAAFIAAGSGELLRAITIRRRAATPPTDRRGSQEVHPEQSPTG
ncbi:MFS transporter [Microbacterium sp.]|uniref:MFS transporter n=1 Tax=Microbacterium sp. TaxID=51671 RepID=UPI003C1C5498